MNLRQLNLEVSGRVAVYVPLHDRVPTHHDVAQLPGHPGKGAAVEHREGLVTSDDRVDAFARVLDCHIARFGHLQALSEAVPAGRHAVLVLDQAGWHTQTAAAPQRFIVAAASGLARAQPHRADVAATARPASGKPLLRRLRANSRRLLRGLECLYTNSRRHPLFMLTKLGNTAFGFG